MSAGMEKSGVSPPILSLPRGGGAIRGLGEKFQPDEHTGVGHFSIPLQLPPGRDGFAPGLSLTYSTAAGNGPFGLGWSLGQPAITRQTSRGVPRYEDDEDTFVLSGAEDLVEVGRVQQGTYTAVRYRPRAEGLFARILHITDPAAGDDFWEVTSRDGIISRYGSQPGSRVYAIDQGRHRIFAWHLDSSSDPKGSKILYQYHRDGGPISPEAHHAYRQVYLRSIKYNNYPDLFTGQETFLVQVDFDYGQYDSDEAPTLEWDLRPDPFSSYRAGFEVRTVHRCQRVLIRSLHEAANPPTHLVRSYDLRYVQDTLTDVSLLQGVVQRGYSADPLGNEARDWDFPTGNNVPARQHRNTNLYVSAFPPLTFEYSTFAPGTRRIETLSFGCDHPPERSLANPEYQLVDLHGGGLPDVIRLTPIGTWCWRNLGRGRFSAPRRLQRMPFGVGLADEGVQFADLQGNGSADLLVTTGQAQGFYENDFSGEWGRYHPLRRVPAFSLRDPNVRLVDVDGDGVVDVLSTQIQQILYYANSSGDGYLDFAPPLAAERRHELESWPDVYFADAEERVRLADMTGDGLQDLVLIHDGRIDFWPNLGRNCWGERLTLLNGPRLPDRYDPRRLFLADVNGDGLADLVYVGSGSTRYWINQSGNRWSDEQVLPCTPPVTDADSVRAVDLFGTGTGGLLWSFEWMPGRRNTLRYLDFTGGEKPLLLRRVDNHMGVAIEIEYRSSAEDYAADLASGSPWQTTLPFPVNVVGQVTVLDLISGGQARTEFFYHHGYYDGREREFRGFGRVDRLENETLPAAPKAVPPVLTRTWYHPGVYHEEVQHLDIFRSEYYAGDAAACRAHSEVGCGDAPAEAYRALAGAVLRTETYSLDGSVLAPHPFTVVEHGYRIEPLQAKGGSPHAVFLRVPLETLTYHYNRDPADPRLEQTLIMQVDAWGNITQSMHVAYPRRGPPLWGVLPAGQVEPRLVLHEAKWINQDQTGLPYWIGLNCETKTSELRVPNVAQTPLTLAGAQAVVQSAVSILFSHVRNYYDGADFRGLSLGQTGVMGRLVRVETLALRPGQSASLYGNRVASADLVAAGYSELPAGSDAWWVQSQRVAYAGAAGFFRPVGFLDEMGNQTTVEYDAYCLFPIVVTAPLNNQQALEYDYCAFAPCLLTDVNYNRTEVRLDPFGTVLATAVMGKAGANEGDSLAGWTAAVRGDSLGVPGDFLQNATARTITRLYEFQDHGGPASVHTISREIHASELAAAQFSPVQHVFAYSDGFGRSIQTRRQTAAGDVFGAHADPRWVCEEFVVLASNGQPTLRLEPFFSALHSFEPYAAPMPAERRSYDGLQRLIRTDHADGTLVRLEYGPWQQTTWDENDAVAESAWYAQKSAGTLAEQDAAAKAYQHRDTLSWVDLDVLGRAFVETANNGPAGLFATCSALDIRGDILEVTDPSALVTQRIGYDLLRRPVARWEAGAGERLELPDAHGNPVQRWDGQGHFVELSYDALNRRSGVWVTDPATRTRRLVEEASYGDALPNAEQHNLRGKVYQQRSEAGIDTNEDYDFKGNLLRQVRRFVRNYRQQTDWNDNPALLPEQFDIERMHDALNRRTSCTLYSGGVQVARLEYSYQPDNLPRSVGLLARNDVAPQAVVHDAEFTPRGERRRISYGNGALTEFEYDPTRSRLTRLVSTRPAVDSKTLQDYRYTFDAAGNVTQIEDNSSRSVFFQNQVVSPVRNYTYDALNRLSRATGREHAAQPAISSHDDPPLITAIPHANALNALRNYIETYHYDAAGNLKQMRHQAGQGRWTRTYAYQGNQLQQTTLGGGVVQYAHDANGNLAGAGQATQLAFDFRNQLVEADLGGGGRAFYRYDSQGSRAVKLVIYQNGTVREHLYLDDFELDCEYNSTAKLQGREVKTRCEIVHVMFGAASAALLETVTVENHAALGPQAHKSIRYQLADGLSSTTVELDGAAQVISSEEYYPFGSTAYHALRAAKARLKRRRFTGKEKDAETGLYYYGARYYAPWLGRWLSPDPESGRYRGWSPYTYVLNNPVTRHDASGRAPSAALEPVKQAAKLYLEMNAGPALIHGAGILLGVAGLIAGGLVGGLTGKLSSGWRALAVTGGMLGGAAALYGLTVATGFSLWGPYRRLLFDAIGSSFIGVGRAVGHVFTAVGGGVWNALSWIGRGITGLFRSAPAASKAPGTGTGNEPPPSSQPKIDDAVRPPANQPVPQENIPLPGTKHRPAADPFEKEGDDPLKLEETDGSRSLRSSLGVDRAQKAARWYWA